MMVYRGRVRPKYRETSDLFSLCCFVIYVCIFVLDKNTRIWLSISKVSKFQCIPIGDPHRSLRADISNFPKKGIGSVFFITIYLNNTHSKNSFLWFNITCDQAFLFNMVRDERPFATSSLAWLLRGLKSSLRSANLPFSKILGQTVRAYVGRFWQELIAVDALTVDEIVGSKRGCHLRFRHWSLRTLQNLSWYDHDA